MTNSTIEWQRKGESAEEFQRRLNTWEKAQRVLHEQKKKLLKKAGMDQ